MFYAVSMTLSIVSSWETDGKLDEMEGNDIKKAGGYPAVLW